MLKRLKVIGPYKGLTGYDHHTREFVRALYRQGVAVELVDLPEWVSAKLPPERREAWFDTLNKPVGARIVLHSMMPHLVKVEKDRFNAVFTMFEATRVPPQWARLSRKHDLTIVPLESSRQAWLASGAPPEQVRVCQQGVNPEMYHAGVEPLVLQDAGGQTLERYRVRFLNVSALIPRKNVMGLLHAWFQATRPGDDAVLIMLLTPHARWQLENFQSDFAALQKELGKTLCDVAPIHFIFEPLDHREMPRLYAAATQYITLSRGEAWCMPLIEAAASGLELIAPRYLLETGYFDESNAHLLPNVQVPAAFEGRRADLFAGAQWWEPDAAVAAKVIRDIVDGTAPRKIPARARVLRDFTWEIAAQRMALILHEAWVEHRRARIWQLPHRLAASVLRSNSKSDSP
jgi:glycosyltransferase involved in cell wall biosynthesis